jgi:hypothetical protein
MLEGHTTNFISQKKKHELKYRHISNNNTENHQSMPVFQYPINSNKKYYKQGFQY